MTGYISEYDHYGNSPEFIELAFPAGTDISAYTVAIYGADGHVDHTVSLSSLTLQSTVQGTDVYVIDATTPGFAGIDMGDSTALVDDTGAIVQFITHTGAVTAVDGPAAGETSTYIGTANGTTRSLQSDDGGQSYYIQSATNPGTVPCYAPGTMIDTPGGPRAVETLRPRDLVLTLDHGPQPIRWVRRGDHPLDGVEVDGKPVLIAAGALGAGRPAQDLIVSPQHRILVGGGGQLTRYFDTEAFAPAKSLTLLPGIRHMKGRSHITWIHFACERHEVVRANGCLSESLLLGPMVVRGLTRAERRVLSRRFAAPEGADMALNGPPARPCLTVGEARRQIGGKAKPKPPSRIEDIRKWDVDAAMERHEATQHFGAITPYGNQKRASA